VPLHLAAVICWVGPRCAFILFHIFMDCWIRLWCYTYVFGYDFARIGRKSPRIVQNLCSHYSYVTSHPYCFVMHHRRHHHHHCNVAHIFLHCNPRLVHCKNLARVSIVSDHIIRRRLHCESDIAVEYRGQINRGLLLVVGNNQQ